MRNRIILVVALGLAMVTSVLALRIPEAGSEETKGLQKFTPSTASSFAEFPIYDLGSSYDGHARNGIYRVDAKPLPAEPTRMNAVTYIYGSCEATPQMACRPPLQVQNWDACERWRGMYPFAPEASFTLRGVPADVYEDGKRLELYTGRVTIVLFGHDAETLRTAAGVLRGANNAVGVETSLPAPMSGALRKQLCG